MSLAEYRVFSVAYVLGCYILSLLFVRFCLTRRQSQIIVILLIIINCAISANRPFLSPDTSTYIRAYNESLLIANNLHLNGISDLLFNRKYYSMEMPFILLMALFNKLSISWRAFFGTTCFVTSVTTISGLHLCEKYIVGETKGNAPDKPADVPMWYMYMSLCGILYSSTAIRAGLCIGLGLCAFGLVINHRKPALAGVLFAIAILFHSIGVLFVLVYFAFVVAPTFIRKKHCAICVGISSLGYSVGIGTVTSILLIKTARVILSVMGIDAFSSYTYTLLFSFKLKVLFYIVGVGILLILSYKYNHNNSRMAFLVIIGIAIYSFASEIASIHRISDYFILYLIPIMGYSVVEEDAGINYVTLSLAGSIMIFVSQYMMIFG